MDQKEYGNILESLQNIRAGVMASCQQELMFTGMMPPAAQAELKVVGDITGAVFHGLSNLGFSVVEDPTNPAMVVVTVNGRSYNCLRMQMDGVKISPAVQQSAPMPVTAPVQQTVAAPVVSAPVQQVTAAQTQAAPIEQIKEPEDEEENPEEAVPVTKTSAPAAEQSPAVKNTTPVNNASAIWGDDDEDEEEQESSSAASVEGNVSDASFEEEENSSTTSFEENENSPVEPTVAESNPIVSEEPAPAKVSAASIWGDDEDDEEEENYTAPSAKEEAPAEKKIMSLTDAINQGFDPMAEEKENSVLPETFEAPVAGNIEAAKEAPVLGGAKVLGGGAKVLGGGSISTGGAREEFFLDETEKLAGEFVYSYSRISVTHKSMGGGGRPEEMLIMIAPLKIHKSEQTSVPIVVAIIHNGKYKMASSYDILEDGKNIVTIDIDEFYFLCRGSFSEDGRFIARVVTTGPSAQQGDKIRPISSVSHGDGKAAGTRNGHIKFHYTAESGPGSIEVIPFGNVKEERPEDFAVIVKNREFVDYYLVSKALKINNKVIIYGENGVKNELLCHWNADTMVAEMI